MRLISRMSLVLLAALSAGLAGAAAQGSGTSPIGVGMPGWDTRSVAEFRYELGEIGGAIRARAADLTQGKAECGLTFSSFESYPQYVYVQGGIVCLGPAEVLRKLDLESLIEKWLPTQFPYRFSAHLPVGGGGTIHN
jgi:hypothetical protein